MDLRREVFVLSFYSTGLGGVNMPTIFRCNPFAMNELRAGLEIWGLTRILGMV